MSSVVDGPDAVWLDPDALAAPFTIWLRVLGLLRSGVRPVVELFNCRAGRFLFVIGSLLLYIDDVGVVVLECYVGAAGVPRGRPTRQLVVSQ